jgi:hypothetical protein
MMAHWVDANVLLETETRMDELGNGRDHDAGADATMVDLAVRAAEPPNSTAVVDQPLSFILQFTRPVPRNLATSSSAATMTETYEKGGAGGRDEDADSAATGTETKLGDPTGRDQDADLGSYAPIGGRSA